MIGAGTLHVVNGQRLCEEQYAHYQHFAGGQEARDWIKGKIARFNETSDTDRDFRELVLKYFGFV